MEVAFMMFIMELRKNSGETAATAINHLLPPNLPFLAEIDIFESFEAILFEKKSLAQMIQKFGGSDGTAAISSQFLNRQHEFLR